MEFKDIFNPLKKCLGDGHNRQYFFRDLMAMITTVTEEEWGTDLDPDTKPITDDTIYNYIKRGLSKPFAQNIVNRLTPQYLEMRIEERPEETREALAKELSPYVDDINSDNVGKYASDLMVEVIKSSAGFLSDEEIAQRKKDTKAEHKNRNNGYLTELDVLKARSFIVSHEKEMELLPLCHIAYLYRPQHQHVRPMYTEYNLLPLKIRKHILKLSKSPQIMKIKSLHIGEAMSAFLKDLIKYELGSESYMYLFNQYFCRAFRYYAKCDIEQYDVYSFPRLCRTDIVSCKSGSLSSLDTYINDYLWMRDKGKTNDISCPLECLFIEKKLDSCSEEELTFWLCRFVIDACINLICKDQPADHDVDDQYAETQEDLDYCALYWLERFYEFKQS